MKNKVKLFFEGIYLVFQQEKRFLLHMFLSFLLALVPYIQTKLLNYAIEGVTVLQKEVIIIGFGSYFLLVLLNDESNHWNQYLYNNYRKNVDDKVQFKTLKLLSLCRTQDFDQEEWLAKMKRVNKISNTLTDMYVAFVHLISEFILLVSYWFYLFQYIQWYSFLGLLIFIPSFVKSSIFAGKMYRLSCQSAREEQRTEQIHDMFFSPSFMKETKIFKSESYILNKWKQHLLHTTKKRIRLNMQSDCISTILDTFSMSLIVLILWLIYIKTGNGEANVGVMITLIPFMLTLLHCTQNTTNEIDGVVYSLREWSDINEFWQKECINNKGKKKLTQPIEITLSNVSFRYEGRSEDVIHNVSFSIKQGEVVALVGENGAGKSTLMKLITGVYQPYKGTVQINGVNINEIDPQTRSNLISMVFQFPVKYPYPIVKNIDLKNEDDVKCKQLCSQLNLNIDELYEDNYILGTGFEHSRNVSGGQWQKISIARALCNETAEVFLFDEPTAALDPIAEVEVFHAFRKLTTGKTVVLSTHRLGIVKNADKIIIIHEGSIDKIGTHKELITSSEVYRNLYEMQSEWYTSVDTRERCENV